MELYCKGTIPPMQQSNSVEQPGPPRAGKDPQQPTAGGTRFTSLAKRPRMFLRLYQPYRMVALDGTLARPTRVVSSL